MKNFTSAQKEQLNKITERTEELYSPYACKSAQAIRKEGYSDYTRPPFAVDADKIIHCPVFNRGSDKTQVFSFYKNDDITRRSSHIQLVSRIARTIGRALRLNLDLIEAIAIGHDVGHTPFGHKGEWYLSELYNKHTGRYFNHNVHGVRVLHTIFNSKLTVQTLDGILCHCGEKVNGEYRPAEPKSFDEFEKLVERCYTDREEIGKLHPSTMEGCVVRLSDMVAYLGKDRQDALYRLKIPLELHDFGIGSSNRDIIKNVVEDLVANSMDKPYLSLSPDVYDALKLTKDENYEKIYQSKQATAQYEDGVKPMFSRLYERFLDELDRGDKTSLIYLNYLNDGIISKNYKELYGDKKTDLILNDVVCDFIASMTDDYFLEAYRYLYPDDSLNKKVKFVGYFDKPCD
ncbi:MAG: HD domain-containing protein [Clostridia bacterium]|nr:HD domain-containing protein [Clostridia bacterium]